MAKATKTRRASATEITKSDPSVPASLTRGAREPVNAPRERRSRKKEGAITDPVLAHMAETAKFHRKRLGLNQGEVALRAGITPGNVFLVEVGRHNMTVNSLMLLAKALEIEVGALFPGHATSGAAMARHATEFLTEGVAEEIGELKYRIRRLEDLVAKAKRNLID